MSGRRRADDGESIRRQSQPRDTTGSIKVGPNAKPRAGRNVGLTSELVYTRLFWSVFFSILAIGLAAWAIVYAYDIIRRRVNTNTDDIEINENNITLLSMQITNLTSRIDAELAALDMLIANNKDMVNMTLMDILLEAMQLEGQVNGNSANITILQNDVVDLQNQIDNINVNSTSLQDQINVLQSDLIILEGETVKSVEGRTPDGAGNVNVDGVSGITIETPDSNTVRISGAMLEMSINNLDNQVTTNSMEIATLQNQLNALNMSQILINEMVDGDVVNLNMTLQELVIELMTVQQELMALSSISTGMIIPFGGPNTSIPSGFLACDGTEYDTTTYMALNAVIGSAYCDGGCTPGYFKVPDLQGRVPAGVDVGSTYFGMRGMQSGSTTASLPDHSHASGTLATTSAGSHRHDNILWVWSGGPSPYSIGTNNADCFDTDTCPSGNGGVNGRDMGTHWWASQVADSSDFAPFVSVAPDTSGGSPTSGDIAWYPRVPEVVQGLFQSSTYSADTVGVKTTMRDNGAHTHPMSGSTASASDTQSENVQPSLSINYIIKT